MGTKRVNIEPAPNRILIKITKKQSEELTSKWITREDGKKVKLFLEPEYEKGFDRRWQQNVSVGTILAVGRDIKNVRPSDIAILDYTVTNDDDVLVGYHNGDQLVSLRSETTIHTDSASPFQDGRRGWIKGDYDFISPILGVVRGDKIIAFTPYVFLVSKTNLIMTVLANGKIIETKEDISRREILSAPEESGYQDGDEILIKEIDLYSRTVNDKEISICFMGDIIGKKNKV